MGCTKMLPWDLNEKEHVTAEEIAALRRHSAHHLYYLSIGQATSLFAFYFFAISRKRETAAASRGVIRFRAAITFGVVAIPWEANWGNR